MERERVDEHGDERPDLFGVPAPIASPRHISPNGTDEDAGGEKEKRESEE